MMIYLVIGQLNPTGGTDLEIRPVDLDLGPYAGTEPILRVYKSLADAHEVCLTIAEDLANRVVYTPPSEV
jgi:hypothetical protein